MNFNRFWVAAVTIFCVWIYGMAWEKTAREMIRFIEAMGG